MGLIETLHLRWDEYEPNIKSGFSQLRNDEDFYDVTIACGGHQVRAHKVILAATSPFFKTLLKVVPHAHPLLYLKGIDFNHMKTILAFMYNGEVQIQLEDLDNLLSAARELQVNGLMRHQASEGGRKKHSPSSEDSDKNNFKRKRSLENTMVLSEKKSIGNKDDLEGGESKKRTSCRLRNKKPDAQDLEESCCSEFEDENDPLALSIVEEIDTDFHDTNLSQAKMNELNEWLDARISEFVSPRDENKYYKCLKCSYSSSHRGSVMKHVEARHFVTNGFSCDICHSRFKTRHTLGEHKRRMHKAGGDDEIPEIKDSNRM